MDLPIGLKRCDVSLNGDLDPGRSIPVVPKSHEGVLTEKELVDYKDQRVKFLSWLLNFGKSPDKSKAYSEYTVYSGSRRVPRGLTEIEDFRDDENRRFSTDDPEGEADQ